MWPLDYQPVSGSEGESVAMDVAYDVAFDGRRL